MQTFFGFEQVDFGEKTTRVKDLFHRVSESYDLMNDLMSVGLHRVWKHQFVSKLPIKNGGCILDVAGGTGDISRLIQIKYKDENIQSIVCDLTASMMECGRDRCIDEGIIHGISWCCGNAEALPFKDNSVDGYVITFGLRNIADRASALSEAYRVLKPGGWIRCLEFSHMAQPMLATAYNFYSTAVIPTLGKWIAKDGDAYQYLIDSIKTFPTQDTLCQEFQTAGFSNVTYDNWQGGLVALHQGVKS